MTDAIEDAVRYVADIVIILVSIFALAWPRAGFLMTQHSRGDVVIHDENLPPEHLIFACDSPSSDLKAFFLEDW
jgi:hypothetical protein